MTVAKRWASAAAALGVGALSFPAIAQDQQLPGGGPPVQMAPPSPEPPPPPAHSTAGARETSGLDWSEIKLEGVHPFFGLTFLGGPTFAVITGGFAGNAQQLEGAFLFALRAGVYIDRNELAFEISPLTYQYYTNTGGPTFQFTGTYRYLIPVAKTPSLEVSWPIGVGVGMMAGNTGDLVFFQARADLVGLNLRTGPLLIDLYFPQFRYAVTTKDGEGAHFLTWFGGASLGYAL
jgi:hypothetical protein